MIINQQIHCPVEDFKNHLEQITKKQESFFPPLWLEGKETKTFKFYGVVGDSSFRLMPLISGKTFFTPVFIGDYQGSEPVAVNLRVKSSPYFLIYFVFLMFAVIDMGIDLLRSVNSGNMDSHVAVVFLGGLVILVIVSLIMSKKKKKLACDYLKYLKIEADKL